MNSNLSSFATRLREEIPNSPSSTGNFSFATLALELFALQFKHNPVYRRICEARGLTPETVRGWTEIPAVPTSLFKELELSSIPAVARMSVFHSSGTTEQKPSRHFHCAESLAVYETSLWAWFKSNCGLRIADCELICLTPPPAQVPHSSLVHMFETVWKKSGEADKPGKRSPFYGVTGRDGVWTLEFEAALAALAEKPKAESRKPKFMLGTAFSFVHLLDFLTEKNLRLQLPPGSRVMETGGYKNRSRTMPKTELHTLITKHLGVPRENILCEYGMSEISSQAYDQGVGCFQFPPWARAQIISPETGRDVADGESGLIRIFDLANVFSVAAIQTEDLAVRRGNGFELIGRAQLAEPRGCSLMTA